MYVKDFVIFAKHTLNFNVLILKYLNDCCMKATEKLITNQQAKYHTYPAMFYEISYLNWKANPYFMVAQFVTNKSDDVYIYIPILQKLLLLPSP
jgi:hypothetical protein